MCDCNNRLKVRIGLRHVVEKLLIYLLLVLFIPMRFSTSELTWSYHRRLFKINTIPSEEPRMLSDTALFSNKRAWHFHQRPSSYNRQLIWLRLVRPSKYNSFSVSWDYSIELRLKLVLQLMISAIRDASISES